MNPTIFMTMLITMIVTMLAPAVLITVPITMLAPATVLAPATMLAVLNTLYHHRKWDRVDWTTDTPDTITVFGNRYKKIGADDEMAPPWASFDFDRKSWWDLLVQHKIDETTRQNLYLLAQMGDQGKANALDLITKLQHKVYKNELENPSRWLHSCCSKAHARLSP